MRFATLWSLRAGVFLITLGIALAEAQQTYNAQSFERVCQSSSPRRCEIDGAWSGGGVIERVGCVIELRNSASAPAPELVHVEMRNYVRLGSDAGDPREHQDLPFTTTFDHQSRRIYVVSVNPLFYVQSNYKTTIAAVTQSTSYIKVSCYLAGSTTP